MLAVETSSRVGSLALLSEDVAKVSTVGQLTLPKSERSAKSLVPSAESLLRDRGWSPADLDLICVASGPGSFTGLRIGVTMAKTMSFATGAALVEVNTLAAIAAGVSQQYQRLWTVLDAQREELFVAMFESGWQAQSFGKPSTTIMPSDAWIDQLEPGDFVTGPPLTKLADRLPSSVEVLDPSQWSPQAELVGQLGIQLYRSGQTTDTMQLVPQYFRKSAAEEKADRVS